MYQYFQDTSNIDLREELDKLLYGSVEIVPIGRRVILRRITDTNCVCWDGISGGPNRYCKYCLGEGYQFTETQEVMCIFRGIAPIYKPGVLATGAYPIAEYGYGNPNSGTAYARYDCFPDYERYTLPLHKSHDKLYELKVDDSGNLFYPLTTTVKWNVLQVTPLMGDFSRVEFFELALEQITV